MMTWANDAKLQTILAAIADDSIYVQALPQHCVGLPKDIATLPNGRVVLHFGYRLPNPIPDLCIDAAGIRGTLSFNRRPCFVDIPMSAIEVVAGAGAVAMFGVVDDSKTTPVAPRTTQKHPNLRIVK